MSVSSSANGSYTNVMERLVAKEVARQRAKLPEKLRAYIKSVEVETYALNRLPALYASSKKGWQIQYEKAGEAYAKDIYKAVRQGIAAVQVDPIRASQPLSIRQNDESEAVLITLRNLLNQPKLSWDDVLCECKRLLLPHDHPDYPPLEDESKQQAHRRPNTYGSTKSWGKKRYVVSQE